MFFHCIVLSFEFPFSVFPVGLFVLVSLSCLGLSLAMSMLIRAVLKCQSRIDLLTWLQGAGQWGPDLCLVLFQSSLSSWLLGFSLPIMQLTFILSVPGSQSPLVHLLASFTLRTSPCEASWQSPDLLTLTFSFIHFSLLRTFCPPYFTSSRCLYLTLH